MILTKPFDRVRYNLSYANESITIQEIRNWKDDDKEYARVKGYDGIFANFSSELEFVGNGKDFIVFIEKTYGINAEIMLVREDRHPKTDLWVRTYSGYLDLSTMSYDKTTLKIRLNSGGLEQILKTRETEKVEIDRTESLDGVPIEELNTIDVTFPGRDIFLLSEMENSAEPGIITKEIFISPTLKKTVSSDTHVISTYKHTNGTYRVDWDPFEYENEVKPQSQQFFYFDNDRRKTINVVFEIDLRVTFARRSVENQQIRIQIQKSKVGTDPLYPDPIQKRDIILLTGDGRVGEQNLTYSNSGFPFIFDLERGECLSVVWMLPVTSVNTVHGLVFNRHHVVITEDSFFDQSSSKMVLAKELGERLIKIMTGRNHFRSKALSAGGFAEATGFAHGFWIRQFEENEDEENRFKPLTTTWKDFVEAMRVTCGLSIGIEVRGRQEFLRMEEKRFFYNQNVTIRLPDIVTNIERQVATDYYYSGIDVGYAKGGEYEEAMGLDEYNGRSTFTTVIRKLKNIFTIVSPYRADSYGAEFARRKPYRLFPTEDTRYDQDIFQFDLKKVTRIFFGEEFSFYAIRKWEDDFEEEPRNVYSPETAFNLRYSPANLILRHGWDIASALIRYPEDYVRYGSSTANSRLKTKLFGREEVSENEDILNTKLGRALFRPEWVTFNHVCDFDVMRQVEGFSVIFGEEIPNFYGLVEYRISENETERGYLFNLKPNGVGEWKILRLHTNE